MPTANISKLSSQELETLVKLNNLTQTIELAKNKCVSLEEAISYLESTPLSSYSEAIRFQLNSISSERLARRDLNRLLKLIHRIINDSETIPARLKNGSDSFLRDLLNKVPDKFSTPILIQFLTHKRKNRREIAFKALKRRSLPFTCAKEMLKIYEVNQDEEILKLIARHPELITSIKLSSFLLESLDNYWRCRVIEAMFLNKINGAAELAKNYPLALIRVMGRSRNEEILKEVRLFILSCVDKSTLEDLGLIVWALGEIKAKTLINMLETKINHKYKKFLKYL